MTTLQVRPEAWEEIRAAWRYYTDRDPAAGRRFMAEALRLFERVREEPRQFPELGLLAVPTTSQTLFFFVRRAVMPSRFPYSVLYYIRQSGPVVLAVAHHKRRAGYWGDRG